MAEWMIRLKGRQADLEYLYRLQMENYDVAKETDHYCLRSSNFGSLADPEEVRENATNFLKIIQDAAKFELGRSPVFEVDLVTRIDRDGTSQHFAQISAQAYLVSALDDTSKRINEVKSLSALALKDKSVADAIHFFSKSNWFNLCKVYEVVRDDVGGERRIIQNGWATKRDIKRFTQTAQSRETLGDAVRHASKKFKPHTEPMHLHEARFLIKAILIEWVVTKE